jgi:hypothetical protein
MRPTRRAHRAAKKQKAANWEPVTFKSEARDDEVVMVLRIWDSAAGDPKWPQVALLRMSPLVYKEFKKDFLSFKAFIDGTQTGKPIFDAPVTVTKGCKFPEPNDEHPVEEVSWLIMLTHRASFCSCVALQERAMGAP